MTEATAGTSIDDLLREMVERGASDLHVKTGSPPGFRVSGAICRSDRPALSPDEVLALAHAMMDGEQRETFDADGDLDFSYSIPGLARFRVNLLRQRGTPGMVLRQIPAEIPDASKLGLPEVCLDLALKPRGLVVVTGPTGSGKSTTLAAMIDHVNRMESGHILTMEDPIEFLHADKSCFVTQRQIGTDTKSFSQGLRRALRQDPDVILIGEMRDLETISMAITAAETGHLVFGTLHTTSAISTVDRIIDVFPPDAQQQIRVQLASTLQGVISQALLPKVGGGRVAVQEILIATDGIRSLVREGKTAQMLNLLQTGRGHGMVTLEARLVELAKEGVIRATDAVAKANRPDTVRQELTDQLAREDAEASASTRAVPPSRGGENRSPGGGGVGRTGPGSTAAPAAGRPMAPGRPMTPGRPAASGARPGRPGLQRPGAIGGPPGGDAPAGGPSGGAPPRPRRPGAGPRRPG